MKNILLFLLLVFVSRMQAEYSLVPAFPNLPDFNSPTELVNSGDGTNRLFLVQEWGLIYVFNNNPTVSTKKVFLDLSSEISTFVQTGILGIAFHPNYSNNHYFYVHYIYENATHNGFITRIARFTASSNNPDSAILSSELALMDVPVDYPGHYGGKIAFGPDGYLYISFGDAGTGGNGGQLSQDLTSLRGKVLRIDVNIASGGRNYSIPQSNPFYNNAQGYREETYAYGLRNMWKFSFDYSTNILVGADVGEHRYEEIDVIQNGKNYGWNKMEGFHCYNYPDSTLCDTAGRGFTNPVFEYAHAQGQSIIGGYVYRGTANPDLYGKYIYADYVQGKIWSLSYPSMVNSLLIDCSYYIVSFGVDQNNELFVVSSTGKILKLYNSVRTLNLNVFIEGLYNKNTNTTKSDTVQIFLRNFSYPYQIMDSSKAFINTNGFASFTFANASNLVLYYLVLKQRNSLETWSSSGQYFSSDLLDFNFTTTPSQAYGNNLTQIDNSPVDFGSYSGDVNQDGYIDLPDVTTVLNDSRSLIYGYVKSDLTGDLYVDLSDVLIVFNNSRRFISLIRP